MDIRDFRTINPINANFQGLDLTYNADAFTGDFLRRVASTFKEMFGEIAQPAQSESNPPENMVESTVRILEETASRIDRTRDFYARILAGTDDTPVLMAWALTDKGNPIPCTEDGMKCLEGRVLQGLYEFIRDHPLPKSPEIPTTVASQTISATTDAGSPTPATLQEESPAMLTTIS